MKHIRLIAFCDEPTGELGLGFLGHTSHEALLGDREGGLIAHDLLEHQNGLSRIGDPADEVEAMGGMWFVRGQHGYLNERSIYSPAQSIGHELCTIASDNFYPWVPSGLKTRPHDCDEDFLEIITHARESFSGYDRDDDFDDEVYLADCLHLMRIGFNKAKRRFGDGYTAHDLYHRIKFAVGPYAKHPEYEGQQFTLSYGNGRAECREALQ